MLPAEEHFNHQGPESLRTLLEISRCLSASPRQKPGLLQTLEILETSCGLTRSAVLLRRAPAVEVRLEVCRGLTEDELSTFLRTECGVTDRVLATGKSVVMSRAGNESLLHRSGNTRPIDQSKEKTFFCVPLTLTHEVAGFLAADMPFRRNWDYDSTLTFVDIVAGMISQALRIGQLSESGRNADPEQHCNPTELARLREQLRERHDFSNLIGNSGPMQQIYDQIARVAPSTATVIIRGESGTGKELIAHAIHHNSLRRNGPFIKVNCAALPDTLIEAELFGFEKGAFTGAHAEKKGRFELAQGGTLFLDEIGELNATTAVKLLRVLQEREFERIGGTRTLKADVRLIVATNKDLEKAILAGTFREDLYYRLNVFSIFLPPLRDRKPDLLLLADHFLYVFNSAYGKQVKRISTPAIDMLMSYHWPGNVRELSNTIERAVLICDDHVIHGYHLPPTLQTAEATGTVFNVSLKHSTEAYEKELIHDTLKTTRGNRARAAKLLHTTERVINYKVGKFGIDCSRFKCPVTTVPH